MVALAALALAAGCEERGLATRARHELPPVAHDDKCKLIDEGGGHVRGRARGRASRRAGRRCRRWRGRVVQHHRRGISPHQQTTCLLHVVAEQRLHARRRQTALLSEEVGDRRRVDGVPKNAQRAPRRRGRRRPAPRRRWRVERRRRAADRVEGGDGVCAEHGCRGGAISDVGGERRVRELPEDRGRFRLEQAVVDGGNGLDVARPVAQHQAGRGLAAQGWGGEGKAGHR